MAPISDKSSERLEEVIRRFHGQRVLVAGDVVLDRYLWGDVERTSPEAPVPVVRLRDRSAVLGGAANVVANLTALGARPALVGVIGADADAEELQARLRAIQVSPRGLTVDRSRPTTVKTRVVSMGQQLLRLDSEEIHPFAPEIAKKILAAFEAALGGTGIVILSDYDKGMLHAPLCREMIRLARRVKIPVVVDPKGVDYRKYRGATVVKPNQKEAQAASQVVIDSPETLSLAARALQRTLNSQALVISRGGLGVSVFERGRPPVHVPAQARSVYDVTGAGDSFIAAMSLALTAGATMAEAATLGNAAGSIVVGKLGAATVEPQELLRALQPGHAGHKLRSAEQLAGELKALRAAGKRIVFTNGCFDLIHLGHIKFLERARQLGDALVLAINSDRSVREIKGPPRPVLGEEERAAILSSLDAVDFVVIFDEATPESLLKRLRPDVLVKGKTKASEEVVGRKIVEGFGGRVIRLPLLGEITTDSVVRRIARRARGVE